MAGNLNLNGDLHLDGGSLYVQGELTVNGSISGAGSVYVSGRTLVHGDSDIKGKNALAFSARGMSSSARIRRDDLSSERHQQRRSRNDRLKRRSLGPESTSRSGDSGLLVGQRRQCQLSRAISRGSGLSRGSRQRPRRTHDLKHVRTQGQCEHAARRTDARFRGSTSGQDRSGLLGKWQHELDFCELTSSSRR